MHGVSGLGIIGSHVHSQSEFLLKIHIANMNFYGKLEKQYIREKNLFEF